MSDKLNKLQDLLKLVDSSMTREEFLGAFKNVLDFVKKIESQLIEKVDKKTQTAEKKLDDFIKTGESKLSELNQLYHETIIHIEEDNQSTLSNLKRWALERVGELFIRSKINERLQEVDDKIAELNNVQLPDTSTIALEASKLAQKKLLPLIPTIPNLEKELPKLGFPIRDGLEAIEVEEEKLKIEAIKNLREELDELKKLIRSWGGNKVWVGGGSGGGGRIVKSYDLSSQLNGSTKTFSLPGFWRIISVHLSSVPGILRETVDYTSDASAYTITFTSEIEAAGALLAGQTCVVIYSE